ncbi:MAG: methionine--tRNA ligase [Lentisphaeria bacterium]|nr:methionine--tRNA ligase [Lentisphaeria bacterium]NQZ66621.1 methionine--tRNA ligase [Lentisphaeria bacterium]
MDNFYITTPIYYVNDKPHIGHAYTTLLADVLARYHRLMQTPTFFLTGTDEHGQKVDKAAAERGVDPQAHCDEFVQRFQEAWVKLGISNDSFIRTTEENHKAVVQETLQELFDKDEIYKADYEGWYCTPCEMFVTEKDLVEGNCPNCNREIELIKEAAYYFKMSKYQSWLIDYINDNPEFIQPDFRRNETLGFLNKQDLNDLCISRPKSRLSWGIELPFDSDYVTYVWFDALVNYISGIGYKRDDEQFNKWWPASYHLIGKDILTTHTVYWPTMLKAMGVEQPKTIFAHGWWLIDQNKMSKTDGNVVNPLDLCDQYGVDAFRYYLMAEMSLGQDCNFTEELFIDRYNNDLAGNIGNMLSRVIKMIKPHFDGKIPSPGSEETAEDKDLKEAVLGSVTKMETSIHEMKINRGLEDAVEAIKSCNRYFELTKPWALAKTDTDRLATVLYNAAEALRIVSGLLYPVIPGKMSVLRLSLGLAEDKLEPDFAQLKEWGKLVPGSQTIEMPSLFPRIDTKAKEKEVKKENAKNAKKAENIVELIDIDQFFKAQLKTAKVIEAEAVEGADRLLKLQLEVGDETRQIVAGIAKWYKPEDLVGKTIVIVSNLKAVTLMGVESNGMLLAAKKGKKKLSLITTDDPDFASGASVG